MDIKLYNLSFDINSYNLDFNIENTYIIISYNTIILTVICILLLLNPLMEYDIYKKIMIFSYTYYLLIICLIFGLLSIIENSFKKQSQIMLLFITLLNIFNLISLLSYYSYKNFIHKYYKSSYEYYNLLNEE